MAQAYLNDTIAAVSTGMGSAGIGIVRISGKDALTIAGKIFVSKDGRSPRDYKTYTVHYGKIFNGQKVIDEVILTVMFAPGSFTREDIVEINCHGGIVAQRAVLELVLENGARLAEPGEFTKRAFLNGRIDLAQAEAVLDIIRAKTDSALNLSLQQLQGRLSGKVNDIRKIILDAVTLLEAHIDFPEEEGASAVDLSRIREDLAEADKELKEALGNSRQARIMRDGVSAVICGKPNVGKSSLLNALLRQERSIVTPIAGTTRDAIEEVIDIKGIPVRIVDTAGILDARDLIEKKAVARSRKYIAGADLILFLFDGSKSFTREDEAIIKKLKGKPAIAIVNKIDLKQKIDISRLSKKFQHVVGISAKKSRNINLLEDAISSLVLKGKVHPQESVMVASLRHIQALSKAQILVAEAVVSLDNKLSTEFTAQALKDALMRIDELLGKNFSDDLLDKIFGEFCIGK